MPNGSLRFGLVNTMFSSSQSTGKTSHKSERSRIDTGLCYGNRIIARIGTLRCY